MMILFRLDDHDIACLYRMMLPVDLHRPVSLQDNERFPIAMNMIIFAVRPVVRMAPVATSGKRESAGREKSAGKQVTEHMVLLVYTQWQLT